MQIRGYFANSFTERAVFLTIQNGVRSSFIIWKKQNATRIDAKEVPREQAASGMRNRRRDRPSVTWVVLAVLHPQPETRAPQVKKVRRRRRSCRIARHPHRPRKKPGRTVRSNLGFDCVFSFNLAQTGRARSCKRSSAGQGRAFAACSDEAQQPSARSFHSATSCGYAANHRQPHQLRPAGPEPKARERHRGSRFAIHQSLEKLH